MRALLSILALATSLSAAQGETLRIGTETGFAPYISRAADGQLSGFDKDLIDAICAEISKSCLWSDIAFQALIPNLLNGEIDLMVGGITATNERRETIAFSQPYLEPNGSLVFVGTEIMTDISMARIAVQEGSVHHAYLAKNNYQSVGFPTVSDAVAAAETGDTDFVFASEGFVDTVMAEQNSAMKIVKRIPLSSDGIAIGLRQTDIALKSSIDAAITKFAADGTLDALMAKWFTANNEQTESN